MNIQPIMHELFDPLGVPVVPDIYTGKDCDHIVYNYADERPVIYRDDTDTEDETTVQVHYFTKSNPEKMKRTIRRLLRQGGFCIISTQQYYENDSGYNHVIMEAYITGFINDDLEV